MKKRRKRLKVLRPDLKSMLSIARSSPKGPASSRETSTLKDKTGRPPTQKCKKFFLFTPLRIRLSIKIYPFALKEEQL